MEGHSGRRANETLGHVYTASPASGCFYLHVGLHTVKGSSSFTDLKTVNGLLCQAFREARGKTRDPQKTLKIASEIIKSSKRVIHLFAILLTTYTISSLFYLWKKYKIALSEDILLRFRRQNHL